MRRTYVIAFSAATACASYRADDGLTIGDDDAPTSSTRAGGATDPSNVGSSGTIDETPASSSSGGGGTGTDAGQGSAPVDDFPMMSTPCHPVNMRPLLGGIGFAFAEDPVTHLGPLTITGLSADNTIIVAGTGRANEVALSDGSMLSDVIFKCVTGLIVNGGGGNDRITLGRAGPAWVNVGPVELRGGPGDDSMAINNNQGIVGNVSINGD
jgi:hypothetical protein